jgi:hypothetical protein
MFQQSTITYQDRLQPIDKWEDYPIKVLDIAPLIMVTLPTMSSFFSTCGCFLRDGRSSSGDLLSLSSLWMASWCEWLSPLRMAAPPGLRVENPSGARKGGRTDPQSGPGRSAWADRPRPTSARFGRPFAPVGPHAFMHFAPSTCTILTMSSSRPRCRFSLHEVRSFTLQSPGMFLRSTAVLATIGSDFIKLINTNKTP